MSLERSSTSRVVRLLTSTGMLVLLSGTVGVSGCGRNEQTARAVEKASRNVHVMGGGGGPAATPAFAEAQYKAVVTELTPVSDKGLPEENAAALVGLAQAQLGLAEQPAGEAADIERACIDRMTVIRSLLGDWLTRNAQAAALDQFDPSAALADFGKQNAEKDKLIADQGAAKTKLDAELADLRARAAQRNTEAQTEESSYAQLKEQSTQTSAVQGEGLVKQAAEHKRKSDALRNQASLLDAQAEQLARRVAEMQLLIDQYKNQKANIEKADRELRDRLSAAKTEAAAARAEAAKTAGKIDALVEEIRSQRTGPLAGAFDRAVAAYSSAAKTAGQAATGDQNGGSKLTLGAAQQALGDLHWAHAHGLATFAQLLDSLAKAEPAMPKRAEFAKDAGEAAAAAKTEIEATGAAYEAAQSAYTAVRSRGEAKDHLDQLSKALADLQKVAKGEAKDLAAARKASAAAEATPAAEKPAAPAEPVAAAPGGTPPELVSAVDAFLAAVKTNKQSEAVGMLYLPPESAGVRPVLVQLAAASDKVDAACRAKFNVGFADITKQMAASMGAAAGGGGMGGMSGMSGGLTPDAIAAIKPGDIKYGVEDDKASVTLPGAPAPLEFVKSEGKWMFNPGPEMAAVAPTLTTMGAPLAKAMEDLAADIEAGKFASTQAVGTGFMQKLMAAMQGAKQPGPGGG